MAVTADQVEVVLRAQTAQYQTDLRAADATFTKVAANATRSAAQVNSAASGLNTANIAAQFQDIGVTAASGMNPLIIALQQGTQLSAIMNESLQRGISPAKALGAAFLQVLNPISLGTIALVALAAAAAQYFGSLISDGKLSNEELKEQESAIRAVADRWGDAVPALQAYVAELDRVKEANETSTAFDVAVEQQFAALKAQVGDIRAEFTAARVDLQQLGESAQGIDALQTEFDGLIEKVENNTVTTEDLNRLMQLLASTTSAQTSPALINLGSILNSLSGALANAAANTAALRAEQAALTAGTLSPGDVYRDAQTAQFQFAAEQERINGLTSEQLQLENEIKRVKAEYARANGDAVLGDKEALSAAQGRLAAEERRRALAAGDKAGVGASNDAVKERDAVLELIAALEYEQSILGMTNEEKAVSNALREAGAAATDEQRARITELIEATMAEADAIKASEQAMQQFQNMASSAITGFIGDLRSGKSAAEALSNVFDNLADQLIKIAVQNLVSAAFGGIGGGGGGIFGAIFGGFKANGGPVSSNKSYIVGERGPELFTPSSAGNITPNGQFGGGSGGEVVVVVESGEYFDARVARVSGPVAARTVASGIGQYDANLSSRMVEQNARNN